MMPNETRSVNRSRPERPLPLLWCNDGLHIHDKALALIGKVGAFQKDMVYTLPRLTGRIFIEKTGRFFIVRPGGFVRFVMSLLLLGTVAACAQVSPDPTADASFYDSRTTTGSNIPRKSTGAVVVDKSIIQDQVGRQVGSLQR